MTGITLALGVAAAGGVGAALRHLVDRALPARARLPWALLVVNAGGSFCLGVLVSLTTAQTWHAVIGTGLLGGFTTFSSSSLDAANRWVDGDRSGSVVSAAIMLVTCVVAAACGVAVGG